MTQDAGYRSAKEMMAKQKSLVAAGVVIAVLLFMTSVLALLQSSRTISSSGTIKSINVGVYENSNCTQTLSSVSWGSLDPGTSTLRGIYVKNDGNIPMVLSMVTNTWNPSNASSYMTLTWDQENTVVTAGNSVQANLNLTVSQTPGVTDFSFSIVVTGTEQT